MGSEMCIRDRLSPFERASGIDGISVHSLGQSVFFDVTINQVVLER